MHFIRVPAARNSFRFAQVILNQNIVQRNSCLQQIRCWSTTAADLDNQINNDLENEVYKPKNHPGRSALGLVELPECIQNAIKTAVKGSGICRLINKILL